MNKIKTIFGAGLLAASLGVNAEIQSMSNSELSMVGGQLGYFDTTHKVVELLGAAHDKAHVIDDAVQAHVEGHVASAIAAAQVVKAHVGEHVDAAKDIKAEVKGSVSGAISALIAHHATHHP